MQQAKVHELQHLNPQPASGNFQARSRPPAAKLTSIVSDGTRELDQDKSGYGHESADPALNLSPQVSEQVAVMLDSYSRAMIDQCAKIERKVRKLAAHWEAASVVGPLAGIPRSQFEKVMCDVLSAYLIHRACEQGVQAMAGLMDLQNKPFESLGRASYVPGLEKILAPLVLVHMRERELDSHSLEKVVFEVFVTFSNLLMPSSQSCGSMRYLYHFLYEDLSQIEWRMDFFNKLFAKAAPELFTQFKGINLKTEFFLHGWMLALFHKVQGLDGIEFTLRIWDLYLLLGEPILYCFALVTLKSKLHQLSNAPMRTWLEFFDGIKKLKIPEHCHVCVVGGEASAYGSEIYDQVSNENSKALIPLTSEALEMFVDFDVPRLFASYERQQLIAEQKNEIFTKMFLDDFD